MNKKRNKCFINGRKRKRVISFNEDDFSSFWLHLINLRRHKVDICKDNQDIVYIEKADRANRADVTNKIDGTDRADEADRTDRPDRVDQANKADGIDGANKVDRINKTNVADRHIVDKSGGNRSKVDIKKLDKAGRSKANVEELDKIDRGRADRGKVDKNRTNGDGANIKKPEEASTVVGDPSLEDLQANK